MNYGLTKTRVRLVGGAAILALSAGAAMAQEAETVVVSSTRLQAAGFDSPTPTTVVSSADLEQVATPSVFDAITQLPSLQGSTGVSYNTGSTTTGLTGLSALGLRGLSPLRTLTLLDGQRVVGANFNGVVDVSQLPQILIQRVDIVTGGASASWGSDAVAGVVNFVTDKRFEGFKMNAQAGLSTYGDAGNATFQAAAGTSFMGGRAHFQIAGEYSYNAGLVPQYPVGTSQFTAKPNIGGRQIARQSGIANYGGNLNATPIGSPQSIYGPLIQSINGAAYGLITSGPKAYYTFGANGQAVPFNLAGSCTRNANGTVTGAINQTCFGTSQTPGDQDNSHQFTQGLVNPLTRGNLYARLSYELTPSTEIYATLNYSQVRTQQTPAQGNSNRTNMTLRCDNAFLPGTGLFGLGLNAAETQAACLAAYPGNAITYSNNNANIPVSQQLFQSRIMRRYVVGGTGSFALFGKDWNWDSYFQHGESGSGVKIYNMPLAGRYNLAQDAVYDAALGGIVCRNAAARLNGCVPYNPFGQSEISSGALAYFDNQNVGGTTTGPVMNMTQRQEAFSFAVNGSPFDTWAGPVAVATGIEYREEYYTQRADPYAAGLSASTPATATEPCVDPAINCVNGDNWNAGNFHNGRGNYHVQEIFVEFGVPLLNDTFWGKVDLSLAGRHARYSTAGDANTWKVGLTWDTPLPGVKLRSVMSRDIRAPNLSELFSPAQGLNGGINNTFLAGSPQQTVRQLNVGNPGLSPEKSQTTEIGLVFQPDFLPGFQTSIDYWRIGVKQVIQSLGLQTVFDQCFRGFTEFCSQDNITTANGVNVSAAATGAPGTANQIVSVQSRAFNAAVLLTDGFDWEASYQFDLQDWDVPGNFTLRSLVTHVSKFIVDDGIPGTQTSRELAGAIGGGGNSQTYNQSGGNVLNWKLNLVQSYQNDVWGINLTERWYSGGVFTGNRNVLVCAVGTCPRPTVQTPTINYNKVSAVLYLDVGVNWNITENTQLYTKVDNVANTMPPDTGGQNANNTLYDVIGRMYRVGVRFNN